MNFLDKKAYAFNGTETLFPVIGDKPAKLKKLWLEFKKQVAPATPAVPYAMRSAWYAFLESEDVSQVLKMHPEQKFDIEYYNKLAGTNYRIFIKLHSRFQLLSRLRFKNYG